MNIFEKSIAVVAPQTALKRAKAKMLLDIMDSHSKTRRYEGAGTGRRFDGWQFKSKSSANTVIKKDLASLRDRSRDLVRNNPYAARARMVISSNTIGQGIIPQAVHENSAKVEKAEALWANWGEKTYCDFEGRHDFYGLQYLVMSSIFESGEVLIRRVFVKPDDKKTQLNIKLQILESDFIDTAKEGKTESGGYIVQGIEFDKTGKKVAYWLFSEHPGGSVTGKDIGESVRVLEADIIHVFRTDRPGQFRGVPWLAPVMVRLRDFDDFEDAQLMRQKVAACFSVFIKGTSDSSLTENGGTDLVDKIEPGLIQEMAEGQEAQFASPPGPDGYTDYCRVVLQAIAAGLGITYEALVTDLSQVNFSSGRMGWLEFNRNIKAWRSQMLIPLFLQRVWEWFIESASLTGTDISDVGVSFTEPRREQIDPVKENNGDETATQMGTKSVSECIRESGRDPQAVFKEIAAERAQFKALGLTFSSDITYKNSNQVQTTSNDGNNG